ncbi:MAG: hypothetical protein H7835_00545 [Magnetococcus sp. XQGC-1]
MITKILLLTCDLFAAAPRIQAQLGAERFAAEFLPWLQQIHLTLQRGPNPEIAIPLVEALAWGFHTPIQPILETLIHAQGFDWRFVTGRRRRFNALANGQAIPIPVAKLWERALMKSSFFMDNSSVVGQPT